MVYLLPYIACSWLMPAAKCRVDLLGLHFRPGWCHVATFIALIGPTVVNSRASVLYIRLIVIIIIIDIIKVA